MFFFLKILNPFLALVVQILQILCLLSMLTEQLVRALSHIKNICLSLLLSICIFSDIAKFSSNDGLCAARLRKEIFIELLFKMRVIIIIQVTKVLNFD